MSKNISALYMVDHAFEGPNVRASLDLVARIALSAIFFLAGFSKIQHYDGTAQYMLSMGVSDALLPAVIALEVLGALALIVGFQTRLAALALAGFSVVSALLFHSNLGDQMQFILFYKNIAMAGGFLLLVVNGAGRFSLDAKLKN